jgi:pimeloyl-ACP methyl ester carboxylesterase
MHHEGEVVLPELLDKLDVERPILLGHSDGGSIVLIFAGKYPNRARALILEAPHVFVEDLSVASIAAAKVSFETTDFRAKLGRYHAHVDETFWGWNEIWLDPNFRSWNIESYLGSIRCPVLCIQGENDQYGTPAQVEAIRAPGARNGNPHVGELQALAAPRSAGGNAAEDGRIGERVKSQPRIYTDDSHKISSSKS